MSYIENSNSIAVAYAEFLHTPTPRDSQIHIVRCDTDTTRLLQDQKIFGRVLLTEEMSTAMLILQPRRLGTGWMAQEYARLYGATIGREIGLAGIRGDNRESLYRGAGHHVVVATCGHAVNHLALLHETSYIVLCNTQEQSLHMTLAKAVIKRRLARGEHLFVVLYTDSPLQAQQDHDYFNNYGEVTDHVFENVADTQRACTYTESLTVVSAHLITMLENRDIQRGAVVCVADQYGANAVEKSLLDAISSKQWTHVRPVVVNNRTQAAQLVAIVQPPEIDTIRVVINVNALETSHIRIDWADAVLSDGLRMTYEHVSLSGGSKFTTTHGSRFHIEEQVRICGTAHDTHYVLCSSVPYVDRPTSDPADLKILPHSDVVLQALEAGIDPTQLDFDAGGIPATVMVDTLEHLDKLGLIHYRKPLDATATRAPVLSEGGRRTRYIEVGVLSKAVLLAATQLDILDVMLPVIATMEAGGMRRITMESHQRDYESDLLDSSMAFVKAFVMLGRSRDERSAVLNDLNVSFRCVQNAQRILTQLIQHCALQPNLDVYLTSHGREALPKNRGLAMDNPILRLKIKACLFAAGVQNLFRSENAFISKPSRMWRGLNNTTYALGNASILPSMPDTVLSGVLCDVVVKSTGKTFTVIEHATAYTAADIQYVAKVFPHLVQTGPVGKNRMVQFSHDGTWLARVAIELVLVETATAQNLQPVDTNGAMLTTSESIDFNTVMLSTIDKTSDKSQIANRSKSKSVAIPSTALGVGMALAQAWGAKVSTRD